MFENIFKLHRYDEASINSVVLNVNQLEYFTYLEIPHDIAKFLSLYCVQEFNTPKGPIELDYSDKITRECLRPWLKIETSIFNTECGFHMYKFQFVDTRTTDVVSLYFAYNLQNSNPDKTSYIYMKNRNAEGFNPFKDGDGAEHNYMLCPPTGFTIPKDTVFVAELIGGKLELEKLTIVGVCVEEE